MKKKLDINKFAEFYWGLSSKEEKDQVYNSEESENMLKKQWKKASAEDKKENENPDFDKIKANIDKQILQIDSKIHKLNANFRKLLKYAAIIAIPLLLGGIYLYFNLFQTTHKLVWVEKSTKNGERLELILADSSRVWLNAGSKIKYPKEFLNNERIVKLEGEAFFEVTHNKEKPFKVLTKKIDVVVLGTKFNLRAYNFENNISTTLVEGKVSVEQENKKTGKIRKAVLYPKQQAVYNIKTNEFVLDNVNVNDFILWYQGKLVLNEKSFIDLVSELERWYNVEIILDKKLETKYNYTITITNEKLDDVLKYIKKTTPGLKIKPVKGKYYISE